MGILYCGLWIDIFIKGFSLSQNLETIRQSIKTISKKEDWTTMLKKKKGL